MHGGAERAGRLRRVREEGSAINRPNGARTSNIWTHSAFRFLLVGGFSYLCDVGLLVALHGGLGVPLPAATSVSFVSTLAINFGLNKVFAFQQSGLVGSSLAKYLALVLINYATTLVIVTGVTALGPSYVVAKTLATLINAVMNYETYRRWVFK